MTCFSWYLLVPAVLALGQRSLAFATPTTVKDRHLHTLPLSNTTMHIEHHRAGKLVSRVTNDASHVKRAEPAAGAPTAAPTGKPSGSTTLHIQDKNNFAILLPKLGSGKTIGDSESDAVAYCYGKGGCTGQASMANGFITAASVVTGGSGSHTWIQVTGCLNPSAMGLKSDDAGGQYDVLYPNGALCTFGGYGASFIEQVEPSARRFCLRCCSSADDQVNCNSHHDTDGCLRAIPGQYKFAGISCDS